MLDGDTVGFIPYPLATFSAVRTPPPPSLPDALQRNRELLHSFARHWTTANPQSADAFEALGLALEVRSELGGGSDGAEGAIRRARALAAAPLQQVRLGGAQVRVKLKRGEFESARVLADSVLAEWATRTPAPDVARELSGLAAFTGRVHLTSTLSNTSMAAVYGDAGIAPAVTAIAMRLFARASLGVCDDTLSMLRAEIDRVLDSYAQPNRRTQIRASAIGRAASLAYPCMGTAAVRDIPPTSPLDRAQRAHAQRDWNRARAVLDTLRTVIRTMDRPGDVSLDHTVQEAWLRAASGDTTAAIRQLDLVLEALPTISTYTVRDPALAGAVGRAMTLRAELAAARVDTPTAQRWAGHALALWASADGPMQPTLRRLRTLASANR
jgi:hypothetical protein